MNDLNVCDFGSGPETTVLTVTFGTIGVLLVALAVPLALRRVRPNGLYGFRTPATLGDEGLWYEVNAKTGRGLVILGLGLVALAVGGALRFFSTEALVIAALVWTTIGVLVTLRHGFTIIRRRRGHG